MGQRVSDQIGQPLVNSNDLVRGTGQRLQKMHGGLIARQQHPILRNRTTNPGLILSPPPLPLLRPCLFLLWRPPLQTSPRPCARQGNSHLCGGGKPESSPLAQARTFAYEKPRIFAAVAFRYWFRFGLVIHRRLLKGDGWQIGPVWQPCLPSLAPSLKSSWGVRSILPSVPLVHLLPTPLWNRGKSPVISAGRGERCCWHSQTDGRFLRRSGCTFAAAGKPGHLKRGVRVQVPMAQG